jgi:hypothetical protein
MEELNMSPSGGGVEKSGTTTSGGYKEQLLKAQAEKAAKRATNQW